MNPETKADSLIKVIKELMESRLKRIIDNRIKEFEEVKEKPKQLFKELCFCILTANFNAERSMKIQREIDEGFLTLTEEELARELKRLGHRYPNTRAGYIVEARGHISMLERAINSFSDVKELRDWLIGSEKLKEFGNLQGEIRLKEWMYTNA